MTVIDDTYSSEVVVPEAGELTERELALLILPPGQEPEPSEAPVAEVTRERVQKMLDLSVAQREGKACDEPGCHTRAAYRVALDTNGGIKQSCEAHLSNFLTGDSTVTLIDPPDPAPAEGEANG